VYPLEPAERPEVTNSPFLHVVGEGGEDGPKVTFAVHSWRRIVRDALTHPALASLPCKKDLYLVALDFSALCDHRGHGPYSAKERRGRALEERPDPSLCELVEITDKQVSKMLKLLAALGFLELTRKAAMGRQAEYKVTIPARGVADVGQCLAVAATLGFRPAESPDKRARRTSRARETQRLNRARKVAQMVVDNAVDNSGQRSVQTPLPGGCAHTPSEECANTPQGECADTPPLPIGGFGIKGSISSRLGTGPWVAETGAAKDDLPDEVEHGQEPPVTVDGQPSGNRWGDAVSQAAIRQQRQDRLEAERAEADPCPGLGGDGCPRRRPVSQGNSEGLCVRCYGMLLAQREANSRPPAGDHESRVPFDEAHSSPAALGADGGTQA